MEKKQHSHLFVHNYSGDGAFGMNRKSDEDTIAWLLQKFSDDTCLATLLPRLSDLELEEIHHTIYKFLQAHFSENEYHRIFLKDDH